MLGLTAVLGGGFFTSLASADNHHLALAMSSLPSLPAASAVTGATSTPLPPSSPATVVRPPLESATSAPQTAAPSPTTSEATVTASASTPEAVASEQRLAALQSAATPTPTPPAAPTSQAPPPLYQAYTVQAGDTVSGIAARFGVRTQDIVNNNVGVISAGSLLLVGANLQVPTAPGILHNIRVGETLADIAEQYGVSLDDILGFAGNQIADPSNVLEGTQILVVNGTPPVVAAPAASAAADAEEEAPAATPEPTPAPTPPPPPKPVYAFIWPLQGRITSYFGPSHPLGIDISVAYAPVAASAAGKVVFVGGDPCCSYGYYIDIQHADGYVTRYGHLSKFLVSRGQQVDQGDTIAISGNTGYSTGAHLHFEIRRYGVVRNPLDLLP